MEPSKNNNLDNKEDNSVNIDLESSGALESVVVDKKVTEPIKVWPLLPDDVARPFLHVTETGEEVRMIFCRNCKSQIKVNSAKDRFVLTCRKCGYSTVGGGGTAAVGIATDQEIKSSRTPQLLYNEEMSNSTGNNSSNDTEQGYSSREEKGVPDSHEAMNSPTWMINPPPTSNAAKAGREKRSYEFLMGLVNNNSKYEVTKIDPSKTGSSLSQGSDSTNATASELLLELMVRIAAHPDHWDKVHKLLQKIDSDLLASKKIVDDLENVRIKSESKLATATMPDDDAPMPMKKEEKTDKTSLYKNEWPRFDDVDDNDGPQQQQHPKSDKVSFVNAVPGTGSHNKGSFPKTFAYHRVTGRPLYLNKNPKAYIAVSVIAPKPLVQGPSSRVQDEDLSLEKELRQLKPWTHNQNLKNMASIRSRWVIQSDDQEQGKKDPSVAL